MYLSFGHFYFINVSVVNVFMHEWKYIEREAEADVYICYNSVQNILEIFLGITGNLDLLLSLTLLFGYFQPDKYKT